MWITSEMRRARGDAPGTTGGEQHYTSNTGEYGLTRAGAAGRWAGEKEQEVVDCLEAARREQEEGGCPEGEPREEMGLRWAGGGALILAVVAGPARRHVVSPRRPRARGEEGRNRSGSPPLHLAQSLPA
eukprot:TRINITY_DN304_c0_g2_i3.p2 TRINITY_DN304_c0_g2~~TRINITY_DN304_c0_g2_i3.p2  ORF type:complete len:129 (-),score=6.69 TRINITY_DN304_c0_g2_i3:382-768(-)